MNGFTFVTVVKDNYDDLEKTLSSIDCFSRLFASSLIIVDGSVSNTLTLSVIKSTISSPELISSLVYIELAPNGVYGAMNAAIPHLNQKFVCFMNSGDSICFPGFAIMAEIALAGSTDKVYYGHPLWLNSSKRAGLQLPFNFARIRLPIIGRMPNHQCMLIPSSSHSQLFYNYFDFPIAADLDLKLELLGRLDYVDTGLVVVSCKPGGISQRIDSFRSLLNRTLEYGKIIAKYYGFLPSFVSGVIFALWHSRKLLIKS